LDFFFGNNFQIFFLDFAAISSLLLALLAAAAARTHDFVAPAPYLRFCAHPHSSSGMQMASGADVVVVGSCNYDQFVYVAEFPGPGETIYGLQILKSHSRKSLWILKI